jgi:hypothetical protein
MSTAQFIAAAVVVVVVVVYLFAATLGMLVKWADRALEDADARRDLERAQREEADLGYYATAEVALCRCGRLLRTDEDFHAATCGVCRGRLRVPRQRGAHHLRSVR